MSKPELKKYLNVHTKDQLVKIILDMYSSNELVKQYCEHLLKPVFVDNDSLDKYKRIIAKEFDLMHPMSAGNSFAKGKKSHIRVRRTETEQRTDGRLAFDFARSSLHIQQSEWRHGRTILQKRI
jgi:hypothetical protein